MSSASLIFMGNRPAVAPPGGTVPAYLAANANHVYGNIPNCPFANKFKGCARWTGSPTLDSNGWPIAPTVTATTTLFGSQNGTYKGGLYHVTGAGISGGQPVAISGDASASITASGQTFTIATPSNTGLGISVHAGVTDLAIVHDDDWVAFQGGEIFAADWVTYMQSLGRGIRLMDMQCTNASPFIDYADLPSASYYTYSSLNASVSTATNHSLPLSIQVAMCNKLVRDMWWCGPHRFTDAAFTSTFDYIFANLNPALNVFLEYSNEVWNVLFDRAPGEGSASENGQYTYCAAEGARQNLAPSLSTKHARQRFYKKRSVEMWEFAKTSFGGSTARLRRVLAGQRTDSDVFKKSLEYNTSDNSKIDFVAMSFYYGSRVSNASQNPSIVDNPPGRTPTSTADCVTDLASERTLNLGIIDATITEIRSWLPAVPLAAYECGQQFVEVAGTLGNWPNTPSVHQTFNDFNDAAESGTVLRQMLEDAAVRGFTCMFHYGNLYSYSTANGASFRWGLKTDVTQADAAAPKYLAWIQAVSDASGAGGAPGPTSSRSWLFWF